MQDNHEEQDPFDLIMAEKQGRAPEPVPREATQELDEAPADDAGVSVSEAQETEETTEHEDEVDVSTLPPSVQRMIEEANALREQHQRLSQDHAALQGRLAPTQRKLAELEKRFTESAKAQPGPNTATPSKAETAAAVGMTPEQWTKYAKDFPEEASAIEARFAPEIQRMKQESQERIAQLEQQLQSFAPVFQQVQHQSQIQSLAEAHPDWQEINAQPQFWQWLSEWVDMQPPQIRQHIDLDRDLNNAQFVVPLLHQYKRMAQVPAAAPEAPSRTSTARSAVTRLSAAPSVRGTAPPRRVDPSMLDDNAVFDAVMEERMKRTR